MGASFGALFFGGLGRCHGVPRCRGLFSMENLLNINYLVKEAYLLLLEANIYVDDFL